jgi:hypothetical protein
MVKITNAFAILEQMGAGTAPPVPPIAARKAAGNIKVKANGYLATEDQEYALADVGRAMNAVAELCESREGDLPELAPADLASLFRCFGRQVDAIRDTMGFAWGAEVTPREVN